MRVLIIGGTGLISTGITRELVEREEEVILYNRGQHEAEIPEGVEVLRGDRTAFGTFERQIAEHVESTGEYDCVIDMVCFRPEEAESARRAFRGRTRQYIFCSTVDVYTKPADRYPITEDAERQPSPDFPYAYHKAECERILEEAHANGEFAVTLIRPALTYGEGGRPLHSFGWGTYYLDRIRRGRPVIIHGDGQNLWGVAHRDDVARAFANAAGNERAYGRGYHVTGEEWLTWNQFQSGFAQALGVEMPPIIHIPTDLLGRVAPEAARWCVVNFQYDNIFDNTSARRDLDYRYRIHWEQGAWRMVNWLVAHDGIEDADDYRDYDRLIEAWQRLGNGMAAEFEGGLRL